jgi:hypothetical protein
MTTRQGLYIIAIIAALAVVFEVGGLIPKVYNKLESLAEKIPQRHIGPVSETIGSITNRYFLIDGQKAYIEINGRPCSDYMPR